jgi:hypothetical protein
MDNFAKYSLERGGSVHPLIIPASETNGTGLMNPSIFADNGKLQLVLRHVNYTFYHSEAKLFQHPWGPLTYCHPENDMHLRTINFYCELNDNCEIEQYYKIDTSQFDTYEPKWDFVGLEDARLFRWDEKLYISGVRRDTTPNGQGRMELSEIIKESGNIREISRLRIQPPQDPNSYCEKNWMPVLDMPFHYVKWSNPTELVRVNPTTGVSYTEYQGLPIQLPRDLRGGTQIMPWRGYYLALTHEVDLFKSEVGRKDGVYRHRFIVWDRNWNIIKYTTDFSIMNAHVEFAVGMCIFNNDVLISFGFQDNASYVLKIPEQALYDFISK